jgi:transcriptional regulator with XRE-family HTH domain
VATLHSSHYTVKYTLHFREATLELHEIGNEIRRSRVALGLTQAQLATAVQITRTTLNQLENGVVKDLGIRKVQALLEHLNLSLRIDQSPPPKPANFLKMASTSASVSFKTPLTERDLLTALLTGKVPPGKNSQVRAVLESPRQMIRGLIQEVSRASAPGKVERNVEKLATAVGVSTSAQKWLKND